MSRIDELLAELAPEGVSLTPLGELGVFVRGNGLQKTDLTNAGFPAIHYGQVHTHYGIWADRTKSFTAPELAVKLRHAHPGDLVIATTSEDDAAVAKATAWLGTGDVAVSGDAYIYRHDLDPRFVSYFFASERFQEQKARFVTGTKVRRISSDDLSRIRIPVPPANIQREIVRILDQFTQLEADLEAELEAELEARRRQYSFYLDDLFDRSASRMGYVSLGETGRFERGSALQKKDLVDRGIPCIHYGQVYTFYGISADTTRSFVSAEFARGKRSLQTGDVFIATTSENEQDLGKAVAWLGDGPAVASNDAYIYRHSMDARYVSYFFASTLFQSQKRRYITGTKVKRLSSEALAKMQIPNVPRGEQEAIADQLDRFDTLVNDLSIGLPAELAARRSQYEYYRDKLLTFEEAAS
ncbi:restriction endonuclease subunit S [Microbacterium maritypicum]